MTFGIYTTRDIGRQILRHRSSTFQEFSQRYAKPTDLGFETREARLQDDKNRQNSIQTNNEDLKKSWEAKQQQIIHECSLAYQWAIENGIAKEQARAVLPEGLTLSRMYMTNNLRGWLHYCQLRMKNGTQKEHMEIAQAIWEIVVRDIMPAFAEADLETIVVRDIMPAFAEADLETLEKYKVKVIDVLPEPKKPWWRFFSGD